MPLVFAQRPISPPRQDAEQVTAVIKAIRSRYLFDQTVHGLPILAAIGTRLPLEEKDLALRDPLFTSLCIVGTSIRGRPFEVPPGWTPDALRAAGFRWVVLHRDLVVAEAEARIEAELRRVLGEPVEFGSVLVFEIPGASPAATGG